MIEPRLYQHSCLDGIRTSFIEGKNRVLLVLETGGGKTVIFTYMSHKAQLKGKRVLILVHRIELLRQTSKTLHGFGVDHGMINPKYTPSYDKLVQVASIQSVGNRLEMLKRHGWEPDIIIADECHHSGAKSWLKVIDSFPEAKLTGVTATPVNPQGGGMGVDTGGIYETMVEGPQMQWLVDEGYLTPIKVLAPPIRFDSSELKKSGQDYTAKSIESAVNKPVVTGSAIQHYKDVCNGLPAIVYCRSVLHAQDVAQEFRNAGLKFYAVDGNMDDETRTRIIGSLGTETVQGVCSCDLISEGTDIPIATVAIWLRPTESLVLWRQGNGRVARTVYKSGFNAINSTKEQRLDAITNGPKPFAFVLDHVGNSGQMTPEGFKVKHGLPADHQNWSLDGEMKSKRKGSKEATIATVSCSSCYHVQLPTNVCRECGHLFEIRTRDIETVEGSLIEITAEMVAKKEARQEVGKAKTLEELRAIAKARGYNTNWANIQFELKQKKMNKVVQPPIEEVVASSAEYEFENLDF